eukprot:CAMPEP_0116857576 /NCGR_PEP_ID=MMETSP0418-20121206/20632_1 /TAXON_ID=1158023 /ORGANISM="Astrosyne radiata, Strain 13vi08-1A" /LENGTH=412 /DNA_ID=CAMNT_0004491279 /DNA_START=57 /DNA_END=1295 /DNA_ORIENTATION=-
MRIVRRDEQRPNELAHSMAKKINVCASMDIKASQLSSKNPHHAWFERKELRLGNLLGSGGFANVYEIQDFVCQKQEEGDFTPEQKSTRTAMVKETQRQKLTQGGKAPYVMKAIRPNKFENEPELFISAGYGLAMEAHFLSTLQHPHILSARGLCSQGCMAFSQGHDNFFIILDRLQGTLDQRIGEWSKQMAQYKKSVMERISQPGMKDLLFSGRLKVARDVASALAYLHTNGVVYRDIKPSNIGFDMEGNVKLFDFGLARELPSTREADEEFRMSARVGTPRYMSPEVGFGEPYNEKADVYSLSLVVWEMLALVRPFDELGVGTHRRLVLEQGQRPGTHKSWPEGVSALLQLAWDTNPRKRPKMDEVHRELEKEYQKLRVDSLITTKNKVISLLRKKPNRSFSTTIDMLRHQ